MKRASVVTAFIAILACLAPAAALADFEEIYDEYLRDGIDSCGHSETELQEALASIPADISAYDPSFASAINRSLEQLAGGCEGSKKALEGLFDEVAIGTELADDGSPGPAPPAAAPTSGLPPVSPAASHLPLALALGGGFLLSGLFVLSLSARRSSHRSGQNRYALRAKDLVSDLAFLARRRPRR